MPAAIADHCFGTEVVAFYHHWISNDADREPLMKEQSSEKTRDHEAWSDDPSTLAAFALIDRLSNASALTRAPKRCAAARQ